jgi:hypothetical protein
MNMADPENPEEAKRKDGSEAVAKSDAAKASDELSETDLDNVAGGGSFYGRPHWESNPKV